MDGEKRKRAVEAPACKQSSADATSSLKDQRKEREVTGINKENQGREAACLELELQREKVLLSPEHSFREEQHKKNSHRSTERTLNHGTSCPID